MFDAYITITYSHRYTVRPIFENAIANDRFAQRIKLSICDFCRPGKIFQHAPLSGGFIIPEYFQGFTGRAVTVESYFYHARRSRTVKSVFFSVNLIVAATAF